MSHEYTPASIETKWLQYWEEQALFRDTAGEAGPDDATEYILFAFPYPSGSGLHVGHVESKTALDILARFRRMQGKKVFFPIGWDAFGLPAENYAIKTGVPPAETTQTAIDTFRRQIQRVGISYDWDNEIATCHPEYYRWTQWIFSELFREGNAYQDTAPVNWCPSCQTVLANEQVVDGACERCDSEVIQKEMKQWFFRITEYADELIDDLEQVDWPEPTKQQQLRWIGRKEGIEISYQVEGRDEALTVFTTRPDTNFGATFVVLAPEHDFAQQLAEHDPAVATYLEKTEKKSQQDREREGRNKTGVFTGHFAKNELTGERMPIWISDFVLGGFGTGAVVGVPGHDVRDFQFAEFAAAAVAAGDAPTEAAIEVRRVITDADGSSAPITEESQVQTEDGTLINSDFLDGMSTADALDAIMDHMEAEGFGERVTTYRLRDWLISRQRYWGVPIPVIYDPAGEAHLVEDAALPWTLPEDVAFEPTGESPLRSSEALQQRTEEYARTHFADLIEEHADEGWASDASDWRPEYDTMDTFVDSSWYFLRYPDSRNMEAFAQKERLQTWLPVDFYMIGPEHIVLHLLYARFFTKFLRDQGYLDFDEPFMTMRHQGMILGSDGKKMSKSKGNVINPDDVIDKFGADTLRVYEMFMGPIDADKPWDTSAVQGTYRFLQRWYRQTQHTLESLEVEQTTSPTKTVPVDETLQQTLHQTIEKVGTDIPALKFNTAIASLMELLNAWEDAASAADKPALSADELLVTTQLLAPFAPFLAEELYQSIVPLLDAAGADSVHLTSWPTFDPEKAQADEVTIPVQVDGVMREQLVIQRTAATDQAAVETAARSLENVARYLENETVERVIYVPERILNFVTSD